MMVPVEKSPALHCERPFRDDTSTRYPLSPNRAVRKVTSARCGLADRVSEDEYRAVFGMAAPLAGYRRCAAPLSGTAIEGPTGTHPRFRPYFTECGIPIHDDHGQLAAYAGRAVDSGDPRYRFPVGFQKSHVLFNYHPTSEVPRSRPNSRSSVPVFFHWLKESRD